LITAGGPTDLSASISADHVFSSIAIPGGAKRLLAGYSGGLDSHVLLHLLSQCRDRFSLKIAAIHVNHGLSINAGMWSEHCRSVCEALEMEFIPVELDARAPKGESQEAWARDKRYAAILRHMQDDDVLLTAHHKDDVAETLLIQLFRGAGPAGLASMPEQARLGRGWHLRPLLGYTRGELKVYAEQHGLGWIEDDSNTDLKYDRNFLRNTILPQLKQRWPGLSATLSRAAGHQAAASLLLDELARIDMAECARDATRLLSVKSLMALSRDRAANTFRYWIKTRGFATPTDKQLTQVLDDVLKSRPDAEPCVTWNGAELRRYRDVVFITAPLPQPPVHHAQINWDIQNGCKLPLGELRASPGRGKGIKAGKCAGNRVMVKFRSGSEVIRKGGHHQQLRKLFQEQGVPVCYRDFVPLVFIEDRLVAVTGLCIDEDYSAGPDDVSWEISWSESGQVYSGFTG